jgi:predicted Zn-dependent peptidase
MQTIELTMRELSRLKQEAVSEAELGRARDQLKSNMVMGLESGSSRMANLARQQMYFGRFFGVEEITREIEAVTPEDIQRLARELFRPEAMAIALLGNLGEMKIERGNLVC